MSSVKRISGDYTISSVGTSDNVSVITHTLTVDGNLVVTGNTTTIQSNNIATFDPTITLNANITGNTPYQGNSGIEVNRGTLSSNPTTALYWNETVKAWQIAGNINNASTYSNIATASTASGVVNSGTENRIGYYANTGAAISQTSANLTWNNTTSVLGIIGNVDTSNLVASGTLFLKTTSSSVASLSGNIVVAAATANSGGTGLYVNNGTKSDELVSKTKARKFGLIL